MAAMRKSAACIVLVLIFLSESSCRFGPFYDPRAGGNVPISTAEQDQEHPRMIPDGSGNAILVWSDQQVHAQKMDDSMRLLWGANGVVVTAADGWQQPSEICSDGAGGVIVVWEDCRNGDDNRDIYVQRITSSGIPAWTPNGIALTNAAGGQTSPAIVADGAGGAIVAWQSGDFDLDTMDIYVQRIGPDGTTAWTAGGTAVCTAAGDQCAATICSDGASGAILAWEDERGADRDIYAQRVDAAGDILWAADGVPVCSVAGDQTWLVAAPDMQGGAVFAWEDTPYANSDIYAQRVDGSGTVQWAAGGVAVAVAAWQQHMPRMIADGTGNVILVWTDRRDGGDTHVYAQRIDVDGTMLWTENGKAICTTPDSKYHPHLAPDGSGGAYFVWETLRNSYDIYAQRVDAGGAIQWNADGVPICTLEATQWDPRIVAVGGGAIIAWTDLRNQAHWFGRDLFGDFVSADGVKR
jgi:hypothetical protein